MKLIIIDRYTLSETYQICILVHLWCMLVETGYKESLTLNINVTFASYVWKKINTFKNNSENFFLIGQFFEIWLPLLHSIYNIGSKININCLTKDLKLCIFNTLNNFTQLKRGPLLKDKTNQIPRDFHTILTTHNAFCFTISPKYL